MSQLSPRCSLRRRSAVGYGPGFGISRPDQSHNLLGVSQGGGARESRPIVGLLGCLSDRGLGARVRAGRDMPFAGWRGGSVLGHCV